MQEYWHSSLLACERYLNSPYISVNKKLYKKVPNSFKEIRPWVKYGWEMILIVQDHAKKYALPLQLILLGSKRVSVTDGEDV